MIVASMHGDVDIRLRRSGAVVVRAKAVKVDLAGASPQAQPQPDGWVETQFGPHAGATPSLIEMRSRTGNVSFAILQ
jgi:hypothetical protein